MSVAVREPGHVIWAVALALALAFLSVDSSKRLTGIRTVTALSVSDQPPPASDRHSPTGYQWEQHRLILPALGTDGYHWIMQTERMLAGDGLRIRESHRENPPTGREVHWSGSVRWWLAGVAVVYRWVRPDISLATAVERTAPWVNSLALAIFMLALAPLLAWRLGPMATALFAFGCVAVYPFYQYSIAGFLDHHGLATMSCFGAVIFLVLGGGGWVRAGDRIPDSLRPEQRAVWQWLPQPKQAQRWFVASAVAAGVGLWISAATIVPVMIGIGLSVLASTASLARALPASSPWQLAPALWRAWGVAGCVTSLAFYVLEYVPGHTGIRLEVNHPLYALAWLGAGDLLYRLCSRWSRADSRSAIAAQPRGVRSGPEHASHHVSGAGSARAWLLLDLLLVGALPAVILLTRATTFRIVDPFLWALHQDYILEFRTIGREFSTLRPHPIVQGLVSPLPLLLLPVSALLWSTASPGTSRWIRRVPLIIGLALGIAFAHAFLFSSIAALLRYSGALPANRRIAVALVHVVTLIPDVLAFRVLFLSPARGRPSLPGPLQAVLLTALFPALVLLALSFRQVRWLGVACALLLGLMVVAAGVLTRSGGAFTWTRAWRFVAVIILGAAFIPYPAFTALVPWRYGYPDATDLTQVVTRDVSHRLRARMRGEHGVVVSGPTTTTWMIYFGGFSGLGTLYWENLDGLRATAAIYGARTAEEARHLIDSRGVTHLVIYSWDPFAREYARLARGERLDRQRPAEVPAAAFVPRLLASDSLPDWLTAVPYQVPPFGILGNARVWIFEVTRAERVSSPNARTLSLEPREGAAVTPR